MKIAIITDTHFGGRSDNAVLFKHQDKFFREVFFPKLKEENVDTILHMGDLFDRRKFINFQSLHNTKEIFLDKLVDNNLNMHIIAGNHDTAYRNTNKINSLRLLLGEYGNIKVYDDDVEELTFDNLRIAMVPWISPENLEKMGKSLKKSKADFVLGHFEIIGFTMTGGHLCEHGLEAKTFANYEKVLSGHFHVPSEKGNIQYIGAPYQMDWSDHGGERGFYLIDTITKEMEFVKNPYDLFSVIVYDDEGAELSDLEDLDPEIFENTFIKIEAKKVNNPALLNKFIDKIESFDVADVKVKDIPVYKIPTNDEEEEINEGVVEDLDTTITKYLEKKNYDDRMKSEIKDKFFDLRKRCETK